MMLSSGEQVKTLSGRLTSPFPKINLKTSRSATLTIKKVDQWLMQNALDEAISKKDKFNERQFKHNLLCPSQSDKDCAHLYLFGTIY